MHEVFSRIDAKWKDWIKCMCVFNLNRYLQIASSFNLVLFIHRLRM